MKLKEYVLTARDSNGNIIMNIVDYYEKYIKPLDPRFNVSSWYTKNLVLCCWKDHHDVNPSMGMIKHKFYKDVKVYHCLGCGATGDVIRMHQRIQKEYYDRNITEQEACLELCDMFGVDAQAYKQEVDAGDQQTLMERMKRVSEYKSIYSIRDYADEIKAARVEAHDNKLELANRVNLANIKYIATQKQLYNR